MAENGAPPPIGSSQESELVKRNLETGRSAKIDNQETMSESRNSMSSSKRAALEAYKVKLLYKKREAEILLQKAKVKEELDNSTARAERQKTELEVNLALIQLERETAVAEIEAEEDPEIHSSADRQEFTRDYIEKLNLKSLYLHHDIPESSSTSVKNIQKEKGESMYSNVPIRDVQDSLNPNATVFSPGENALVTGLSTFLMRKDFQLSRLSIFDEKPESFASWRATFQSITSELNLSPLEEVDLLVKHLGKESSGFASSIRSSNFHDPCRGLDQIWARLQQRYGCPEMIETSLKKKLSVFPRITRDFSKLYDLLDILCEIESLKSNPLYSNLLAYFDSSSGVSPIVSKLPYGFQDKWAFMAAKYKKDKCIPYPPFSFFVTFIREMCELKNDPAFMFESQVTQDSKTKHNVFTRKQDVNSGETEVSDCLKRCPLHKSEHSLNSCRGFRLKPIDERKQILRENRVCFRCCESISHLSRDCKAFIKCMHCGKAHASAMHVDRNNTNQGWVNHGGESKSDPVTVSPKCTVLCGDQFIGKSCSKTILVDVYRKGLPDKKVRVYAIIDEQSNRSLGSQELFNKLQIQEDTTEYTVSTCFGRVSAFGRLAQTLCIKSVSNRFELEIPTVIECDDIPSEISEVPTPEIAKAYPHLQHLASEIPELDPNSSIHLLIGRDLPEAHHVLEQVTGKHGMPFAQRLALGWVIVGEVCLGKVHAPDVSNVFVHKTSILQDGRGTLSEICPNCITVKEHFDTGKMILSDFKGPLVFAKTVDDNKVGLSTEDRDFLRLMDSKMKRDKDGFWTAPLPFRQDTLGVPNNRPQAWRRAQLLDSSLKRNSKKKTHFVEFMDKVFSSGAAEVAPENVSGGCYYLPLFGVYHPKKPDQLRGVFDSSATYQGVSLNDLLMSGPDLVNSLIGILLRFRKDACAVTGDVEQMFYRFRVCDDQRDYLRFFWYKDNNPDNDLTEYRMTVHVFGNSASPAVATYGLRKAVENADKEVKLFVGESFYVDDALTSKPNPKEAIALMQKTQLALKEGGNIRLHKIASNNVEVMAAFPNSDLGRDLKCLDLSRDTLPMQHSLGMSWDLANDVFLFHIVLEEKPFTRRGMLSVVNSIFDPLGLIAPITVSGKILLREVTPHGVAWDQPLSVDHQERWNEWKKSLQNLREISIPRMFTNISLSESDRVAVYIFSDASEKAIAAVSYIKVWDLNGKSSTGFLLGKTKLAPSKGHTIPRLELCGAVLSTEIAEIVSEQLEIPLTAITYFTDSKVVLGYISNRTRRFFNYVSNRVERILKVSTPAQWRYVASERNPADHETRCSTSVHDFENKIWLSGPKFIQDCNSRDTETQPYPLIDPDEDKELKPMVKVNKTLTANKSEGVGCQRFERFSSWVSLTRAIAFLKNFIRRWKGKVCTKENVVDLENSEKFILKETQRECFQEEISQIRANKTLPKDNKIIALSPILDAEGLLRVGGLLNRINDISTKEISPVILPKGHHISWMLIKHHHDAVKHQGRVLTEGALRSAGFWLIGSKGMISSFIHKCVICRRLRRGTEQQKMADLPEDRITPGPPFTSVGVDAFGPWEVVTRKTRGGAANSKRWAIMFSCLTTRAIHIELIEEMSSSSFINALRRFLSIRGPVKLFRSDRGTNFVGAVDNLGVKAIRVEDGTVDNYLKTTGIKWIFNAPHSSHMSGAWERMIGLTRRVLDSILFESRHHLLTHETLSTFMAEVTAILNNRPLVPISQDPTSPMVLRPSMLLTGKCDIMPICPETSYEKETFKNTWKRVQVMADLFWKMWRRDYLPLLQARRKWHVEHPNLQVGDIVLLKELTVHRNEWPIAIVQSAFKSKDGKVRKVEVRVRKNGKDALFVRPVQEVILLVG